MRSPLLRLLLPSLALLLVIGWLCSQPMSHPGRDLVDTRAYLEDASGQLDIRTVESQSFKPFSGPLFLGNSLRPVWLKLTLLPSRDPDWVLHVQSNLVNHAEVYLPAADGGWTMQVTGTRHAFSQRPLKLLTPAVRFMPSPTQATTAYVRIVTATTPIHVMALRADDAERLDSLLEMIGGLFVGFGLMLFSLSGFIWVVTRDPLWGLDALVNLSGLFMLALHLGLAAKWAWPDAVNLTNQVTMIANCAYVCLLALFIDRLYRLFGMGSGMLWTYVLTILLFPVELWLVMTGRGDHALFINNFMILVQTLWTPFLLVRARHADMLLLTAQRIFFALLLGYNLWWVIAIVFKVQTGNLAALYPNMPTSMFTMIMMLLLLVRNTQLKVQEASRLALEKIETEHKLQFERQRHEETSSFLGLVLHEVKSPLNYIRMATSNLERELSEQGDAVLKRLRNIQNSVDSVDDVLQRSIEVDSLEQSGLQLSLAEINLAALIAGLCQAHPASARIRAELPPSLVAAVDPDILALILRNLLDNAHKYSSPESVITVRLSRDDTTWQLQVRNLVGQVGFPDDERIFTKYYRAPLASQGGGMGLGLYWVAGAVSRMDGRISYVRDKDEVVFTLCLPI